MRRSTSFFRNAAVLLFLFFAFSSVAQKKIIFDSRFKPQKKYSSITSTNATSEVDFEGPEEKLNQIRASGQTLPMVALNTSEMRTTTTTGTLTADQKLPVTMEFGKVKNKQTLNGREMPSPDLLSGIIVKGSYDTDNVLDIDTLIGTKVDGSLQEAMKTTITSIIKQVRFPSESMKVGDTFDQVVPLKIPIGGGTTLNMVMSTNYKLRSIEGNNAFFDLIIKGTMDVATAQANMTASGAGTGVAVYDVQGNLFASSDSTMDMTMSMQLDDVTMTLKIKSATRQSTKMEN